jgi:hypothetical protein
MILFDFTHVVCHGKFSTEAVALRGERVIAGPTSSAVIDRQGMYWLAGKWKISGDGKSFISAAYPAPRILPLPIVSVICSLAAAYRIEWATLFELPVFPGHLVGQSPFLHRCGESFDCLVLPDDD